MFLFNYSGQTVGKSFIRGVDNAQIGEFDLNQDGINDIVIFDRAGDILIPMLLKFLQKV